MLNYSQRTYNFRCAQANAFAAQAVYFSRECLDEDWNQVYWESILRQNMLLVTDPEQAMYMSGLKDITAQRAPAPYTDSDVDFEWPEVYFAPFATEAYASSMVSSDIVWWPKVKEGPYKGTMRSPPSVRSARTVESRILMHPKVRISEEDVRMLDVQLYSKYRQRDKGATPFQYQMTTIRRLSC